MTILILIVILLLAVPLFSILLLNLLWHLFWKPDNWWQRWQKPKVIALFQTTKNGQKLLNYIQQHGIELEIPLRVPQKDFWSCYTTFFQRQGVLIINKRNLALLSKKNGEVESSIAHELGHLAIDSSLFLDISICPYAKTDFFSRFNCPYKEFLAWQGGRQILQELKININKDKFWHWAREAIKTYSRDCQLDLKMCPKLMADKESVRLFK